MTKMEQRKRQFVKECAKQITEWPAGAKACARFIGTKSSWWRRNVEWRSHYASLSENLWLICTKSEWQAARGE